MRATPWVATLTLAAAAAAQPAVVFPSQATTVEGETGVTDHTAGVPWWPTPNTTPGSQDFRMQVIYDLPSSVNQSFGQIAYRRDSQQLPGWTLEQFLLEVEVRMSTSPNTAATASTTFANNVGADETTVIARKRFALGSQAYWETFPEPFNYKLLFDNGVSFPYNGQNGSLCVEVRHYYNDLLHVSRLSPLIISLDAMTSSTDGIGLETGGRCPGATKWDPPIQLSSKPYIDDTVMPEHLKLTASRKYGWHHSRGYLMVSTGLLANGIPAPRLSGAPPSCGSLFVDPLQMIQVVISDSDDLGNIHWPKTAGTYVWDFPYNKFYGGFVFYTQELSYDIHTTQFLSSNYVVNQIPVYLGNGVQMGVQTVYADGPGSTTAASGTLGQLGLGPVTRFQ